MTQTGPQRRVKPHYYVSTACYHEEHQRCRLTCKFCDKDCRCRCHREGYTGDVPQT